MKRIILIAIYPALCLISSAQVNNSRNYIEEMSVLEKSTFECVYSHIMYDADLDRDIPVDGIFQLGRDYARSFSRWTRRKGMHLRIISFTIIYIQLMAGMEAIAYFSILRIRCSTE